MRNRKGHWKKGNEFVSLSRCSSTMTIVYVHEWCCCKALLFHRWTLSGRRCIKSGWQLRKQNCRNCNRRMHFCEYWKLLVYVLFKINTVTILNLSEKSKNDITRASILLFSAKFLVLSCPSKLNRRRFFTKMRFMHCSHWARPVRVCSH